VLEGWEEDEEPDCLRDSDRREEVGDLERGEAAAAQGGGGKPEYGGD